MKHILLLLVPILMFALNPDPQLLNYQKRYSICQGKTNYQIAQCLLNGKLNFYAVRGDGLKPSKINRQQLREAEQERRVYNYILSLLPNTRRYVGLLDYVDYLYSIKNDYIPPRFRGDVMEDMVLTKRVLNLLQDARLEETPDYTPAFEAEIVEFQRRHGLATDGEIGPATKRALKVSIQSIIKKVKKNIILERLSPPKGDEYVYINIPEFMMYYYRYGEPMLNMKVVVGKPKMRTPVFHREMKYIVLNPRWNVPPSIYIKEYADKSYEELQKKGFDFNRDGKLYQKSGRRNALGVVKFLFPNKFNVYMHDTPAKSLFRRDRRAFSHGCIRLEKPIELLHTLGYERKTRKNKWITLENKIPVYVEYHTVWVDDEGIVQFRDDIYGYERKLF
ncbi:MAG: L,D-transpeptidase family protein [Epsilonproteobacteria bacterium]|nr:L,D-transpeptidase family protein [Campylobacterota bacterium]